MEFSDKLLSNVLGGMVMDVSYVEPRTKQMMVAFGRRLERLFMVGKDKFAPDLIKSLKMRNLCGIFIFSIKSKSDILRLLSNLGWGRSVRVHIMENFPRKNYFDLMTLYDVVIFRKGPIPIEVDVYFLDDNERGKMKKSGAISVQHHTFLLTKFIQTFLRNVNPFSEEKNLIIVGIGGRLKGVPSWYLSLESLAKTTLLDQTDQPILTNVSLYFAKIGCYIPECVGFESRDCKYWHQHFDPDYPTQSLHNVNESERCAMISFGAGYYVQAILTNGKERRFVVPIEIFHDFFDRDMLGKLVNIPESYIFLSRTVFGNDYKIGDSMIDKIEILSRRTISTLEFRNDVCLTMMTSIMKRERPNLVLISPKGSMKTTFKNFCVDRGAKIIFIDSDDFGIAITKAYFEKEGKDSSLVYYDVNENFIVNWFRAKFCDFEIPFSQLDERKFLEISNTQILIDEFADFWKKVYDKGYDSVPSFNNYVNEQMNMNSGANMIITLCHNIFEARLCHSKAMFSVDSGIYTPEILERRCIEKEKTVAAYLAEIMFQRFCLGSKFLYPNIVGWGDVILLLKDLGVLSLSTGSGDVH